MSHVLTQEKPVELGRIQEKNMTIQEDGMQTKRFTTFFEKVWLADLRVNYLGPAKILAGWVIDSMISLFSPDDQEKPNAALARRQRSL